MKKGKLKNKKQAINESSEMVISAQDINLIRARDTSRNRRNSIEWFSMS